MGSADGLASQACAAGSLTSVLDRMQRRQDERRDLLTLRGSDVGPEHEIEERTPPILNFSSNYLRYSGELIRDLHLPSLSRASIVDR